MVLLPQQKKHNQQLQRIAQGCHVVLSTPKNAFKYPDAEGAVFPQNEIMKPIDFRSDKMPLSGYAFRGNRRKYSAEEKAYMENLAKTGHPEMQVLAGGGGILAKTGQRVSLEEAALITTAAERPEAAAIAMSAPASAASAVAMAVAQDTDITMEETPAPFRDPTNEFDPSRRPIVKDTRREKRTAERRPRANAKGKRKQAQEK
jgi:hypothetical protein